MNGQTALTAKEHRRRRTVRSVREVAEGYLFLLPWLCGLAAFVAYPVLYALYISFHKVKIALDGTGLQYEFVGMGNFKYAFLRDHVFPAEMLLFFRELLLIVPITVIFALLVSILLNQKLKGRMFFRAVFFLPVIFATGQVLLELFNQGQGGLPFGNQYDVQKLLYDLFPTSIAGMLMGLIGKFVIILWFSGVQVIIFLAAFQTVPGTTYEAARIDGATPWESFWKITFPAVVPFIFLNIIYTLVEQSTNPFNPILSHINANMSDLKTGYGYASALGWIYFALIFIPILLIVFLAGKRSR